MQAHQEPSATTGAVTGTSIQTTITPLATVTQEEEDKEEEQEETQDKEESAIKTLVELPKIGTPTKIVQMPSTDTMNLQISTPGSSSKRVARTMHYGIPELDEEIQIPYYDSNSLTKERMNEI